MQGRTVPLNRLDELFLGLDSLQEPWNVHFEVRVGDRLDPERLADAVRAASRRHPLARARLAAWRATDRGYWWEIADELGEFAIEEAACADEAALAEVRARHLSRSPSLEAAPPFVLLLAHGPHGDTLVLNVHHAAADGIGAVRLMRSILRAYAGADDPLPALDAVDVRDVRALAGASSVLDCLVRLRALMRSSMRQWLPPSRIATEANGGGAGYGVELIALSPAETAVVHAQRAEGATVNDVLLAALTVAVRRWNAPRGRAAGRVTLSMPVNLRPRDWRTEVVGNFASYVTVEGSTADEPSIAQAAIARQTRVIKRDGLAGLVVDLLAGPSRMTVAAKRRLPELIALTGNVAVDTASLSNLGVLEPLGDGVEGVWFSPPGRMPLGAAIGVVTHDDRLHVALRYRHAQFDAAAAAAFAGLYRDVLLTGCTRGQLNSPERPVQGARTRDDDDCLTSTTRE